MSQNGDSEKPGQPLPEGGPPPPPRPKRSLFGRGSRPPKPGKVRKEKRPKPPKVKKAKAPKPPRKPLFGGRRKKDERLPPPAAPAAVPTQLEAAPPGAPAQGGRPGLTGQKGPKQSRQFKNGSREPKPARQKKPLFSFGKKKKPPEAPAGRGPARGPLAKPPEKKPKKSLFGKGAGKKQAQPKPPKPAKPKRARGGMGKTSPVGLDLGRASITAVQLKHQVAGEMMLSAALDELPDGLIQEGEVRDVGALAFAIKEFWKANKIRGRKVALGLANQKVVVRTLEFPMLEEKELRSAIEFQAQDYIPIPIEDAVFDFHVLGHFVDKEDIEKQKVLVVAAQKNMVMDFIDAVKKAKLSIDSIDLQAFAMLRSLAAKSVLELTPAGGAIAIANIASDVTNLVVEVNGEPQFTRIVSFGGDNFTKAVQEFEACTFAEAEALKVEVGLAAPGGRPGSREAPPPIPPAMGPGGPAGSQPAAGQPSATGETAPAPAPETAPGPLPAPSSAAPGTPAGGPAPGGEQPLPAEETETSPEQVRRILEATADQLADEIRRSLDYYQSQESSAPITKLLLSGGGALLPNLDQHLSQIFPFEVSLGDPLKRITQNRSSLGDEEMKALAPRLAIAVGLALEDEE